MVNTKFWSDNFVVDKLNALDRYLFLYLLTNERTNLIGIYEIPLRTASFETGIEKDDLEKMLQRLSPKVEYFDGWVYIRNFSQHQKSNPSIDKGMAREVFNLPHYVIKKVLKYGVVADKLTTAFDELERQMTEVEQTATVSDELSQSVDSLSQSVPNVSVTKPNLTKPNLTKPKGKTIRPASKQAVTKKVSSKEIDELFNAWTEIVGYSVTSQVKTNREYAAKLIREYPAQDINRMIQGVALSHGDQYAPRISNFTQLYKKWDDLKAWGKRSHTSQGKSKGVVL